MASIRGSFDSDHTFTGFVQIPTDLSHAVSLAPRVATETQYPDGRIATVPLAWGVITLGAESREGFVHIQQGTDEAIVGVELLRLFRNILVLSVVEGTVLLIDDLADLMPA